MNRYLSSGAVFAAGLLVGLLFSLAMVPSTCNSSASGAGITIIDDVVRPPAYPSYVPDVAAAAPSKKSVRTSASSPPDAAALVTIPAGSAGGKTPKQCFCRPALPVVAVSQRTPLQVVAAEVAVDGAVIMTLATAEVIEQLTVFKEQLTRLGIRNLLVIALDDAVRDFCLAEKIGHYRATPLAYSWAGARDRREVISAMKFAFIAEILKGGVAVLLSDTDVAFLDDPMCHFTKTDDLQGMTDGWSPETAYGFHSVVGDPPLPDPWQFHMVFMNSGFFFVRPSIASVNAMEGIAKRLQNENLWDQAAYNDEILFPRTTGNQVHGGHQLRFSVLDYFKFSNSKVAFHLHADIMVGKCPVVVHINYHSDKAANMRLVVNDVYKTCVKELGGSCRRSAAAAAAKHNDDA